MPLNIVAPPYPVFTDRDGTPLENGYVYLGQPGFDAETNPIPVFWDSALTVPAVQPIRTVYGYLSRNGTPAKLFANDTVSMTVKNVKQEVVFSSLTNLPFDPSTSARVEVQDFTGDGVTTQFTLTSAPVSENNTQVFINGVYQNKDGYSLSGNVLTFSEAPPAAGSSIEVVTFQTFTIGETDASFVSYQPSGVGSVQTTVQAKLRETVSVKDFGAVGDGVTDDTAAIQNFLNACKDGRGYMPPGVYRITAPVIIEPAFSYIIEGASWTNDGLSGTVIYNTGTDNAVVIDNTPYTPPNFDSEIKLINLVIRGNINSKNGLYVNQTPVYMENIWMTGNGENGMLLVRPYGSSFRQVTCANNYQAGAFINTAGNLNYFDHCVFNGNGMVDGYAGVFMTSTPDPLSENFAVTFVACDFTGNGTSVPTGIGALITKTIGVSFIGCYWEGNNTYNLYADNTVKNLTVIGAYFQDSDNFISGVDGVTYENNFHLRVSKSTQVDITGGMPTARLPARMFGNTYSGGAAPNPQAGVSENIQLWFTSPPSGGTWKVGDIVWNSAFQNGGGIPGWTCITAGTPGTWLPMGQAPFVLTNAGDNDATLTVGSSFPTNIWRSPLTANRTITLSTTNAFSGAKFRINRTTGATGAFALDVGGLKSLSAGQWCDVEWDGSAWVVTAFGSL